MAIVLKQSFLVCRFLDVILSGIGTLIWFIILTSWIVVFQTHRVAWGEFADYLSFIIPLGEP